MSVILAALPFLGPIIAKGGLWLLDIFISNDKEKKESKAAFLNLLAVMQKEGLISSKLSDSYRDQDARLRAELGLPPRNP